MAADVIIRSILASNAGVAALVADRVSHGTRAPGESLPGVTFHQITGTAVEEVTGATDFIWDTYQVNCWGANVIAAANLATACKAALKSAIGQTVAGSVVDHVRLLDEGDVAVLAADNAPKECKGKRLDIRIAHKQ